MVYPLGGGVPVSEHCFISIVSKNTITGSTCLMLKKILLFSFTLIRWTLNLILHVLSFFLCTCVGWILIVICAAIGTFIYFYYYYFNCQGQVTEIKFSATNHHLIVFLLIDFST